MKVDGVSHHSSPPPIPQLTRMTQLYVYPVKALRGVPLTSAQLTPQGIKYDRVFMLWSLNDDGSLGTKLQASSHAECALFHQEIVGQDTSLNEYEPISNSGSGPSESPSAHKSEPSIVVRYLTPMEPLVPHHTSQDTALEFPLEPDISALRPIDIDLFGSKAKVYRMGEPCDAWFSACLGFPTALLYIGDGRRPQLGFRPGPRTPVRSSIHALISYISGIVLYILSLIRLADSIRDWLVFSDMAPFLVTSTSSLADISSRIEDGPIGMHRFRPNIVLRPDAEDLPAWSEDFWSQLTISPSTAERMEKSKLQVTGNCCRCVATNVDYTTGRPSKGTRGTVFKKLMSYRRIDKGSKYEPVFGRYASLLGPSARVIRLGDDVEATTRSDRDVWDWPTWKKVKAKAP